MQDITSLKSYIGHTKLQLLSKLSQEVPSNLLYGKVEKTNYSGSIKDRPVYQMIKMAIKTGKINQETIIIEPTSGNTGISLAKITQFLGLKCFIVMPETMSQERKDMISQYGATLVLTPASLGMNGSIKRAYELQKEYPNSFIPMQFENPNNALAHLETGKEINEDLPLADIIVAGVGTGGTITGIGEYYQQENKKIVLVAVEPFNSRVLEGYPPAPHQIQGIGAGFIPKILDQSLISEVISVTNEEAFIYAKKLAKEESLDVGISSGAALCAAIKYLKKHHLHHQKVVIILPDGGERYRSIGLGEIDGKNY